MNSLRDGWCVNGVEENTQCNELNEVTSYYYSFSKYYFNIERCFCLQIFCFAYNWSRYDGSRKIYSDNLPYPIAFCELF